MNTPTYSDSKGNRYTTDQIERKSNKAAKELLSEQRENEGYNKCEKCGINDRNAYIDVSHNLSRKQAKENGEAEKVWDKSNMEILCRDCHQLKDKSKLNFQI